DQRLTARDPLRLDLRDVRERAAADAPRPLVRNDLRQLAKPLESACRDSVLCRGQPTLLAAQAQPRGFERRVGWLIDHKSATTGWISIRRTYPSVCAATFAAIASATPLTISSLTPSRAARCLTRASSLLTSNTRTFVIVVDASSVNASSDTPSPSPTL